MESGRDMKRSGYIIYGGGSTEGEAREPRVWCEVLRSCVEPIIGTREGTMRTAITQSDAGNLRVYIQPRPERGQRPTRGLRTHVPNTSPHLRVVFCLLTYASIYVT